MTTFIPFAPNPNGAPPFQAMFTLDGTSVVGTVTWNFAGQRYYLTLTNQSGTVLWCGGLVGSPLNANIFLAPGVFTISTILYREDSGNFEVTP